MCCNIGLLPQFFEHPQLDMLKHPSFLLNPVQRLRKKNPSTLRTEAALLKARKKHRRVKGKNKDTVFIKKLINLTSKTFLLLDKH